MLWLADYLQRWRKSLVVVSHDVEFLSRVCTHTMHLHARQLDYYRGGYDAFRTQFAQKQKDRAKAYEKQQKALKVLKAGGKSAKAAAAAVGKGRKGKGGGGGRGRGGAEDGGDGGGAGGEAALLARPKEYQV